MPTKLYVPDNKWHFVDMLIDENFGFLSKKKRKELIRRGSAKQSHKYEGMEIFGTIRVIHVK